MDVVGATLADYGGDADDVVVEIPGVVVLDLQLRIELLGAALQLGQVIGIRVGLLDVHADTDDGTDSHHQQSDDTGRFLAAGRAVDQGEEAAHDQEDSEDGE